jgi:hypothetical protein
MKRFSKFVEDKMPAGQRGLDYEFKIYNAIKKAKVNFFKEGGKPSAGFSNVGAGDIEGTLNGKPFNIEVKLSADDQMGGGSFSYDLKSKKFKAANKMDAADEELLLSAVRKKTRALDAYILAAKDLEPTEYHGKITGIPINTKVSTDASFIEKHYNKKGVYYIQIGGAGLFYMGKNPFKLPVPRLKGEIQVEIRLAYSGTKGRFPDGTETRTAGLRFQGRLKTKGMSPHTIDTVEGIEKLFLKDWRRR